MKKRWVIFWLAGGGAAAVYILLCILAGRVLPVLGGLMLLLWVYWVGYYYLLDYTLSENVIYITSGILFKRRRRVPLENILWEMKLTSPLFRGCAMTVIHTSGGITAVFGEILT